MNISKISCGSIVVLLFAIACNSPDRSKQTAASEPILLQQIIENKTGLPAWTWDYIYDSEFHIDNQAYVFENLSITDLNTPITSFMSCEILRVIKAHDHCGVMHDAENNYLGHLSMSKDEDSNTLHLTFYELSPKELFICLNTVAPGSSRDVLVDSYVVNKRSLSNACRMFDIAIEEKVLAAEG